MRVHVLAIGRLKGPEKELCARYAQRIQASGRAAGFVWEEVTELPEGADKSPKVRRQRETQALLARVPDRALRVVLSETGTPLSTAAFARQMFRWRDMGQTQVSFLIGGADGLAESAGETADFLLSLGPMTFPHGLARVVLLEQIYRVITLATGHPYHR